MAQFDRTGRCKLRPLSRRPCEGSASASCGVQVSFQVLEYFSHEAGDWLDLRGDAFECEGRFWFQRRDGSLNQKAVTEFIRATGWDGRMESLYDPAWVMPDVIGEVRDEHYLGKVYKRVDRVRPMDESEGGSGTVNKFFATHATTLAELAAQINQGRSSPAMRPSAPLPPDPDIPF